MMAPRRRLLFLTGLIACLLRAHSQPVHHVVKKDLRVDLSLPSLGVVLSQMLHRKAPQLNQRSPLQYDNTVLDDTQKGDATDSQQNWTGSDVNADGGGARARTHRGRFGQDMVAQTGMITFPTEHGQGDDRREKAVLPRWQNLMEPRETPPADLVMDMSRPPAKLRRSNVDVVPFRTGQGQVRSKLRSATAELSATITNESCNCTELLKNDTFSTVVFLVPHSHKTAGEAHKNGSLIREVIRASLSKSVQVERIYEKGCHCGRTGTALKSPSTAATEKKKPPSCARNSSLGLKAIPASMDVTRLSKTASVRRVMPTTAFAGARMHLPEIRLQTTMASAVGRLRGTKCPVSVFVKLPGEELPARAKHCRKLWLPEIVYKEETFWECEDHGSTDCRDRTPAGNTHRALLARESGSFPAADTTAVAPFGWFASMLRTRSTETSTATSEEASRGRTLSKCGSFDDASRSGPDGRPLESAQGAQASSNESWQLSIRIPFHPFDNASKIANATMIRVTTANENVKHQRYATHATKSSQTKSKTNSGHPFALPMRKLITVDTHPPVTRSTTAHTAPTQYTTVTTPPMTYSTSTNVEELPLAWPIRCPQYDGKQGVNNSLAFILLCAAARAAAPDTCKGSSCELKKHVADPFSSELPQERSTHYHLHDDYDFVWTRTPAPSTTVSRSLHYRAPNGTAFPYPFRDSHVSATNIRRGGRSTAARKRASLEHKTAIFREVAPTSKRGAARNVPRKVATTETTTYLEIIVGEPGSKASPQQRRATFSGLFAGDDSSHRNVGRWQVPNKQGRSLDGPEGQHGGADQIARRPPGKRLEEGHGDAERNVFPPVNIDPLKSRFSMKALDDKVRNSECKEARCNTANSKEKSLLEQIVVLSPPAGTEYEYYYVEEEPTSTEHPVSEQRYRSAASFMMAPVRNQALERRKRKVRYESQRFGGSIRK